MQLQHSSSVKLDFDLIIVEDMLDRCPGLIQFFSFWADVTCMQVIILLDIADRATVAFWEQHNPAVLDMAQSRKAEVG